MLKDKTQVPSLLRKIECVSFVFLIRPGVSQHPANRITFNFNSKHARYLDGHPDKSKLWKSLKVIRF